MRIVNCCNENDKQITIIIYNQNINVFRNQLSAVNGHREEPSSPNLNVFKNLTMGSKMLLNIFNNKNKSTTTSTSSTVFTKIYDDQNISVSTTTATNTNIVDSDDESITNNITSGYLDLGDLNSGPMRPILKVSTFFKFPFLIVLIIIYIYAILNFKL